MNSIRALRKLLKRLDKVSFLTRAELRRLGYSDDFLDGCPYVKMVSQRQYVMGRPANLDEEKFSISDAGINLLDEYHYKYKPLLLSTIALILSGIAIIISMLSSDFLRGWLLWLWSALQGK